MSYSEPMIPALYLDRIQSFIKEELARIESQQPPEQLSVVKDFAASVEELIENTMARFRD